MIEGKLKKWGSSLGLVIPREIVVKERLKVGEEIIFNIKKKVAMKEIFGSLNEIFLRYLCFNRNC